MFLVLLLVPRWKKLSCQVTSGDIPSVVALDPWAPKTWAGQVRRFLGKNCIPSAASRKSKMVVRRSGVD